MNISQISPWNFLFFSNEVSGRGRGGMALQIPARSGPGARGEVGGKKEEVPTHLLVVLDWWEKVGKMLDGGGQGAAAEVQRRRGSPMRDW